MIRDYLGLLALPRLDILPSHNTKNKKSLQPLGNNVSRVAK